jgi:hypothetical protein
VNKRKENPWLENPLVHLRKFGEMVLSALLAAEAGELSISRASELTGIPLQVLKEIRADVIGAVSALAEASGSASSSLLELIAARLKSLESCRGTPGTSRRSGSNSRGKGKRKES